MKEEKKEIEIGIVIVILLVAVSLIPAGYSNVVGFLSPYSAQYGPIALAVLKGLYGWITGLTVPVSVLLLIGIVAAVEGTKHVRREEEKLYDHKVETAYDATEPARGDPALSRKWDNVMVHVDSPNQSDWRQAIIEADIILGEILTKMQYPGDNIGDQLKAATKADFNTLDQAWEAHRIRNQIAHEGSDFQLSQHEAKRVIGLFRQVFEEFFYI